MTPPHIAKAILLLGPTASGKTPLGELLAARGLRGTPCVHFDFGAELRDAAACDEPPAPFTAVDLAIVRDVLRRGALLEDSQFHVAEKILRRFLAERCPRADRLVVLNGRPRHVGQAEALDGIVDVTEVVVLECDAATIAERIRRDTGGDRAARSDDEPAAVAGRVETYRQRTAKLIAHYAARGVPIVTIPVRADTLPAEILNEL